MDFEKWAFFQFLLGVDQVIFQRDRLSEQVKENDCRNNISSF